MKLVKLEIENVLGIPDGSYSFVRRGTSPADRVTLLVGSRGAGKTSLLEAIVFAKECIGAYGPPQRPESMLRAGASSGRLHAQFQLDAEEQRSAELDSAELAVTVDLRPDAPLIDVAKGARQLLARFSASEAESKLEYFPDNRSIETTGVATTVEQEKRLRPTRSPHKYAGLLASLEAMSTLDGARALEESSRRGLLFGDDAPDSLGAYRRALVKLCPDVHLKGVLPKDGSLQLMFSLKTGAVVPARALSGAQRQGLLFAGTIVRFGLGQSLILVDMPELFLHMADHESFYRGLLAIAPDAQLVVATGSSSLVQCVGRDQTIALVPSR